jgi:carboxypeptidase C (cathepsin A)
MNEEEKKPEEKKTEEKKPEPKDNLVETRHSLIINGKEIKYTVTAGTMVMKEETLDREKELQGHITMSYYEVGHMMYVHIPSIKQLKQDLAGFIQSAIS